MGLLGDEGSRSRVADRTKSPPSATQPTDSRDRTPPPTGHPRLQQPHEEPITVPPTPPRLSIIITNYNYEKYIEDSIVSAINLDWANTEIIVVDDGSSDHSREIIEKYSGKLEAIFQENRGQTEAYNTGFFKSTGDYVVFLDADDMVEPDFAAKCLARAAPGVSKIQCQMQVVNENGQPTGRLFPRFDPAPTPEIIRRWHEHGFAVPSPPGSGNIYSRRFLEAIFPLDGSLGRAGDSYCIAAAHIFGNIETIKLPLVKYRIHDKNDSNIVSKRRGFATEIERGRARVEYVNRLRSEHGVGPPNHAERSLESVQFRAASWMTARQEHPLSNDSRLRMAWDAVTIGLSDPTARAHVRLLLVLWVLAVLASPPDLARTLINRRYKRS